MESQPSRSNTRPTRRLVAVLAAVAVTLGASVASANHLFTDVPTGSPHHADIGAIQYAGITGGCAPGLYCPDQAVRRDQMATFLRRGYARTAFARRDPSQALTLSGTPMTLAALTIEIGGVPGRTQTVKLDAVTTAVLSLPGTVGAVASSYFISQDGFGIVSDVYPITNVVEGPEYGVTGAATTVVSVPTGTTQTFRLMGYRTSPPFGTLSAYGALSAITGTFGSTGGG